MCLHCENEFSRKYSHKPGWGSADGIDALLTDFATRKIRTVTRRLDAGKPTQKCECLSVDQANTNYGYQCGSLAQSWRNGRPVCYNHSITESVTFIDASAPRHAALEGLIRTLIKRDSTTRAAIIRAIYE